MFSSFNKQYEIFAPKDSYFFFSGTGSYPPSWKGWHFKSLRTARYVPFIAPCLEMAIYAYWEHVGVNRQQGLKWGEIAA